MRVRGLLFVVASLLAFPAAVPAQEPGVNVDPDSPSGKEYAIPLDRARGELSPSTKSKQPAAVPQSSTPGSPTTSNSGSTSGTDESAEQKDKKTKKKSELFGAGVTPASSEPVTAETAALTAAQVAGDSADDGGFSPWLLALVLVALGGAAGFGIRALVRRDRSG